MPKQTLAVIAGHRAELEAEILGDILSLRSRQARTKMARLAHRAQLALVTPEQPPADAAADGADDGD